MLTSSVVSVMNGRLFEGLEKKGSRILNVTTDEMFEVSYLPFRLIQRPIC